MLGLTTKERMTAIQLAKKDGLIPEQMTTAQWRMYSVKARTPKELVRDTAAAGAAVLDVTVFGRNTVTPAQYEKVKTICLTQCPATPSACHQLADGQYVCSKCDCAGKMLNVKWRHKKSKCPIGAWDNAEADGTTDLADDQRPAVHGDVLADHTDGRGDLPVHGQQHADHA